MEPRPGEYLSLHFEPTEGKTEKTQTVEGGSLMDAELIKGLTVEYSDQESVEYSTGDESLSMSYARLSDSEVSKDLMELQAARSRSISDKEKKAVEELIAFYYSPAYKLKTYKLQKGKHVLDLANLSEEITTSIIFNPEQPLNANVNEKTGQIMVCGDLTVVGTILAVLHEAGHSVSSGRVSDNVLRRYKLDNNVTEQEARQILESERDAWAFAIRKIKPFLKEEQRAQVLETIHSDFLKSHSDALREQLAPAWKLIIPHIIEAINEEL